jgi:1-acyl-sn-glycerol-3-phosphate acyltransferase
MAYRFQPPRESLFLIRTVNLFYPALLALRERIVRISIEPSDWRWLEELRHSRALLLPNHPSETEPCVMAGIARRLGQPFNYVATDEIFQGITGWFINRMGAFTIRRGWPDRASLRLSRLLLAERDRKLVIFPEGETHMQNDVILPLHKGAVQIGFWSLERLEALGKPLSLRLVPVVIRYRYVGNPRPALRRGLHRLEIQLGLPPRGDPKVLPDRLLRAGLAVLRGVEQEYGVGAPTRQEEKESIGERIAVLYDLIATRVTNILHVKMPADRSVRLRMRALYNATFDYLDRLAEGRTPYERRLHARRVAAARTCLADLWRVQNFMSISGDCLASLTAERAGELLFRLEKEVYGEPRTRPWREAVIRLGRPMELADRMPEYRVSRKRTVAQCTAEVEERLRTLLGSLSGVSTPLSES